MRIAIIGIYINENEKSFEVQEILHEYSSYIEGRMGVPKVSENLNIITLIIKAPQEKISAMTGKLGQISGVSSKAYYYGKEVK